MVDLGKLCAEVVEDSVVLNRIGKIGGGDRKMRALEDGWKCQALM